MSERKREPYTVGMMTSRDALVYAAGEKHGMCTVIAKSKAVDGVITFKCVCNTLYSVGADRTMREALRNVPETLKVP